MNTIKQRKISNKRTPWIKSRYSRAARAIRNAQASAIIAQAHSTISAIRQSTGSVIEKSIAINECQVNAFSAVASIPLHGSKS